jgi:hypothetical protein
VAEIQRWTWDEVLRDGDIDGEYVTYADHVAAVAEARNDEHGCDQAVEAAYEQGQRDLLTQKPRPYEGLWLTGQQIDALVQLSKRDAIAKAVAAVEGLTAGPVVAPQLLPRAAVIAAIKAVGGE